MYTNPFAAHFIIIGIGRETVIKEIWKVSKHATTGVWGFGYILWVS